MKNLYIVDAVNFLFRAYYAIGPITNLKGESTNALYGFIRSIFKIVKDFSPDYIVAVFDGPDNKKSRTDLYSEYKSHRTGMPEDLFPQLEKALDFCRIAGLPHLCVPGVEADDTMGSIARWAEKQGLNVFLCSSDKDLCQLVTDKVKVINPHKDNLLIDRHKVKELFGVTPEQIIDLLAMMGDASDNIPGLEGFGPKTAASLLSEFGTLEYILAHPEVVSGKKQETIIKGKEVALLSKQLATIHLGVEFPQDLDFFQFREPTIDDVRVFYQEMHFMSLLKELGSAEDSPKQSQQIELPTQYHLVDDPNQLMELIEKLKQHREICIDTETTSVKPMRAQIVGVGLGIQPGEAWYIPMNGAMGKEQALSLLKPLLLNAHCRFIGHNIKYDMHVLCNEGILLSHLASDTMVASYVIASHIPRHNLDQLALEKFNKVKIDIKELIGKGKTQVTMDEVPVDKVCEYCCEDVDYTLRLKELFDRELQKGELKHVFEQIELPLIPILMQMEREGIYVDTVLLQTMSKELQKNLSTLEHEIYDLAGEQFNINSPKKLSVILFEKLGLKPPKKTTTGYSTAADVLESLKAESPIVQKLLDYRGLEKLRSTYVDALPEQIEPRTGRIHCTFNQSVAATGRLSCQDPNLQNIPVRTEMGKAIRTAFKPQLPAWSFLAGDYSQIELRLLAHLSEDPALIQAFRAGEDIHAYTASLVFDVALNKVTSEMRYQAKTVNFGILYGQSPFGLSQELGISYQEAVSFINTYFQRYRHVKDYLESCKEQARQTGFAFTLTGRQRPIPDMHSKNPILRSQAERLAINTPLQGTAADLIKMAMIQVDTHLKKHPHQGKMILQIHDELLFEVPDTQTQVLGEHVKRLMEQVMELKVPLVVDISIGKNWGEC